MISRLLPVTDLSAAQHDAMRSLLAAHFDGVSPDTFAADLAGKNWAILLYDNDNRLAGFSTLLAYEARFEDRSLTVIVSGDTIVSKAAWGSAALARGWIDSVNRIRAHYPPQPCYWLLITSGYRTYRFLPVFWKRFHPCFYEPTPPATGRLLHHLASERYGDTYDAVSGVVRLPHPQVLKPDLAGVPAERLADPHVAFFLRCNPGHVDGDELVSLCELSAGNLTPAGERMVRGK